MNPKIQKGKQKDWKTKKNFLVIILNGLNSLVKQTYEQVRSREKNYCLY